MAHLGSIPASRLPCISDFDPGANDDSMSEHIDVETDNAIEVIGRACRAFMEGNPIRTRQCADLLREAAEMLAGLADEVSQ